jgi:murein DD-endopeptidase
MNAVPNQLRAQRDMARRIARVMLWAGLCLLAACSSVPHRDEMIEPREPEAVEVQLPNKLGDEVALRAIAQVGKPYRYGGADLKGFDCSGLVFFVHNDLGIAVPRTASQQYAASTPVNVQKLMPGDLLFFHTLRRKRISHVGIYAGGGRFVHAPQTGGRIEVRELNDEYYGTRLIGAGRLYERRD